MLRHFWIAHIVVIALCAFLGARALAQYLGAAIVPPPPTATAATRPPAPGAGAASTKKRDISHILDRNIFCSACEPATAPPASAEGGEGAGEGPAAEVPRESKLDLQLIATIISEDDDSKSFAAIHDPADSKTKIYSVGSAVPGGGIIMEIMETQVRLLIDGKREEYLALASGSGDDVQPATTVATNPRLKLPKPVRGLEEVAGQINRVAGTKYELPRDFVDRVLDNPALLTRSARFIPVKRDGQPVGFRFFGKKGSLGSLLGIFGGDLITGVNGQPLTSPKQAEEVFRSLRGASHLSLDIQRKGTQFTHDYYVR